MMLVAGVCSAAPLALAAPPEPVDAEFLDYLATVEGKDDNWTVVASDKERRKVKAPEVARPKESPPDAPKPQEARP